MSGFFLITIAVFAGAGVLFVLALVVEAACGQSPRQHYRREQESRRRV